MSARRREPSHHPTEIEPRAERHGSLERLSHLPDPRLRTTVNQTVSSRAPKTAQTTNSRSPAVAAPGPSAGLDNNVYTLHIDERRVRRAPCAGSSRKIGSTRRRAAAESHDIATSATVLHCAHGVWLAICCFCGAELLHMAAPGLNGSSLATASACDAQICTRLSRQARRQPAQRAGNESEDSPQRPQKRPRFS